MMTMMTNRRSTRNCCTLTRDICESVYVCVYAVVYDTAAPFLVVNITALHHSIEWVYVFRITQVITAATTHCTFIYCNLS